MSVEYTYVLAQTASATAFSLPPREQRRLAAACARLVKTPNRMGDYVTRNISGRTLQNLLIDDWVITYWTDHGACELRIVEIVQV